MDEHIKDVTEVKVRGNYDVIVVGGGIAGIAAALAARRQGCDVLLIEKTVMLGGLATLGMVVLYNPALCDTNNRKLVGGIAEELRERSIRYGYGSLPKGWAKFRNTCFSPNAFVLAADELLASEGVKILFDALFCKTAMEGHRCLGVILETKGGREFYGAKAVVDATGDCDVMHRSGATCVEDDNWLTYWALSTDLKKMEKALESGNIGDAIHIEAMGARQDGAEQPEGKRRYRGLDAEEISEFIMEGRKLCLERVKARKRDDYAILTLPGIAQFRTTRRIVGLYELSEKDRFAHFDDSIGCSAEEVNEKNLVEIPYRTLVSNDVENIVTAGRSISSSGRVRDLTRLIAICALTGEAAGIASALALNEKNNYHNVPVPALQAAMKASGNAIHF